MTEIITAQSVAKDIALGDTILTASTHQFPVVHLKGVGRFCSRPGCNRRIEGVIVKRIFDGIGKVYYRPAPHNKRYCSSKCRNVVNIKRHNFNKSKSLMAKFNLDVVDAKEPYRELTIYLLPTVKETFRITRDHMAIWDFLEKISRFRESPLKSPTLNTVNIVKLTK